jgi:UDP-glucose 4-epimerase
VVDAFIRAADPGGPGAGRTAGKRFVIGTGVGVTDVELHREVARAAGGAPEPEFAPPRLGDLPAMVVDSSAAAEVLGWRPRTSLAEGLALTVKAMRET